MRKKYEPPVTGKSGKLSPSETFADEKGLVIIYEGEFSAVCIRGRVRDEVECEPECDGACFEFFLTPHEIITTDDLDKATEITSLLAPGIWVVRIVITIETDQDGNPEMGFECDGCAAVEFPAGRGNGLIVRITDIPFIPMKTFLSRYAR